MAHVTSPHWISEDGSRNTKDPVFCEKHGSQIEGYCYMCLLEQDHDIEFHLTREDACAVDMDPKLAAIDLFPEKVAQAYIPGVHIVHAITNYL